jgi:hypothetical protein
MVSNCIVLDAGRGVVYGYENTVLISWKLCFQAIVQILRLCDQFAGGAFANWPFTANLQTHHFRQIKCFT